MSRVIAGPFNRVEGDLEVALDIRDGRIERAEVTTTLYRGFEQILLGRPSLDALVIAPRICGICSVSQSVAAATALRRLGPLEPAPNGLVATNIAHAAENIADHLTHFYLFFMPDFARDAYAGRPWHDEAAARFRAGTGSAHGAFLPARKRLLEIMGIIAGKWPHSLAFQPGGLTRTLGIGDRVQLATLIAEFRGFVEKTLFGTSIETVIALADRDELDALAEGPSRDADFARFLRIAGDLALDRMGQGPGLLLSHGAYERDAGTVFPAGLREADGSIHPFDAGSISEDVTHAWMEDSPVDPAGSRTVPDAFKAGGYTWAKAPRLGGRTAEVGAIARQAMAGHPLIADLLADGRPSSVMSRIVARMVETACLLHEMEGWLRALRLREPFCNPEALPADGQAAGLVEAARGALGHWIAVRDGTLSHYQIIAPTTWNFSPRDRSGLAGPLESALEGLDVGALGAGSPAVQHVVRSFDPCMVCTAH